MFYVLYSPSHNQYVNVEGDFAGFADAEKHEQRGATLDCLARWPYCRSGLRLCPTA